MQSATPKLPVLAIVGQSWGSVSRNLGLAARLTWPWMAIMTLSTLAIVVGVLVNSGTSTPSPALIGGASVVPAIVMLIAVIIAIPAVAVGWHRGLLTGERPSQPIRIDNKVWAYLGYSILLTILAALLNVLVLGLASVVAGITLGVGNGPMSLERLAALAPFAPIAFLPTLLVLNRFLLVLPAHAIGRDIGFGEALHLTKGNTLRLTLAAGIVTAPIAIVQGIGQLLLLGGPSPALLAATSLVNLAVLVFCSFASLSFLSLSLRSLTQAEPA
ncbi:MAG: hypothetical protein SFW09_10290 [Hyphomicrobiaceae bacterium]|nr:hypothetical protein [Hyphomicrobiaceae bacterium]